MGLGEHGVSSSVISMSRNMSWIADAHWFHLAVTYGCNEGTPGIIEKGSISDIVLEP